MRLWLAGLLSPPWSTFSPDRSRTVAIRTYPLIGMPSWIPLHLHVAICCGNIVFDFVPDEATSPLTLAQLLSGSAVTARIRQRPRGSLDRWRVLGETSRTQCDLATWAAEYPAQLSLLDNNCWTFASALVCFALEERDGHGAAAPSRPEQ